MPKYHDRLVADMGLPTCRKSNPLSELLMPYNARDYSEIFGLPDRTAWMRVKALIVVAAALLASLVGSALGWLVAGGACVLVHRLPEDAPRLPLMAARTTHALSKSDPKLVASMVGAVGAIWIVGYTAMAEH